MQETRAISILARQSIASGDAQSGMLAAMAILPQSKSDLSRPRSPDATMALYEGWLHNREVTTLLDLAAGYIALRSALTAAAS